MLTLTYNEQSCVRSAVAMPIRSDKPSPREQLTDIVTHAIRIYQMDRQEGCDADALLAKIKTLDASEVDKLLHNAVGMRADCPHDVTMATDNLQRCEAEFATRDAEFKTCEAAYQEVVSQLKDIWQAHLTLLNQVSEQLRAVTQEDDVNLQDTVQLLRAEMTRVQRLVNKSYENYRDKKIEVLTGDVVLKWKFHNASRMRRHAKKALDEARWYLQALTIQTEA